LFERTRNPELQALPSIRALPTDGLLVEIDLDVDSRQGRVRGLYSNDAIARFRRHDRRASRYHLRLGERSTRAHDHENSDRQMEDVTHVPPMR
jgi:hypothetical protein